MHSRFVVLALVAACGDGASLVPDALPPDAPPDAPPVFPACAEFSTPTTTLPAHVTSTLAGADVQSPSSCTETNAPYGVESRGADRVVPIAGLREGVRYVVKLESTSDLAFYVTTGCSTSRGPSSDQCVLFQDESLGGTEVGSFVASGPVAWVVVDYYATHAPPSNAFTLDVYAQECASDDQCSGTTPACGDGLCVGCTTSFHCDDSAASRCDLESNACAPGIDMCAGDDAAEPADDGPAGARVLASGVAASGAICGSPLGEADYYAFDVTTLGDTWDVALAWSGSRDIDVQIFDEHGGNYGLSLWEQPETIRLTYLPIGRYFVRVRDASVAADAIAYAITATRTPGAACASTADCAREYRNQIYRGTCAAGACVKIDGDAAIPEGGACDSQSDCAPALSCPSFFFVADANTRQTCARGCLNDAGCPTEFVCTTYFANNFCVRKCTTDEHCPTVLDDEPASGPWTRFSCNISSGRCVP
jgi:hypothetical protein